MPAYMHSLQSHAGSVSTVYCRYLGSSSLPLISRQPHVVEVLLSKRKEMCSVLRDWYCLKLSCTPYSSDQ